MRNTIQFDHQPSRSTVKIRNERTDGNLTAKFQAALLMAA